jgi:hypothetical protein
LYLQVEGISPRPKQKNKMTTEQIQAALEESKASAVMIVGAIFGEDGELYVDAKVAMAKAESNPTPQTAYAAEMACLAFLVSDSDLAMSEISARNARRARR